LDAAWSTDLENLLSPPPSEARTGAEREHWTADLIHEGKIARVGVHTLSGGGGEEYVFLPTSAQSMSDLNPPGSSILSEIRVLVASGSARFAVTTQPASLGPEILHHLPGLLLGGDARTVAITDRDYSDERLFVHRVPWDLAELDADLQGLSTFRFAAVSADLSGAPNEWIDAVLDVAQTAFVLWGDERDRQVAHVAGVRWHLKVGRTDNNELEWALQPLRI